MKALSIGRWQAICDLEATHAAYSNWDKWGKNSCRCIHCKNFFAAIDQAYPTSFVTLLESLGIRPGQETEVYHNARMDYGLHNYGGWFYFVGTLLAGADGWTQVDDTLRTPAFEQITDHFKYGLSSKPNWIPPPFENQRIVTVEFNTEIPWILSEVEPS